MVLQALKCFIAIAKKKTFLNINPVSLTKEETYLIRVIRELRHLNALQFNPNSFSLVAFPFCVFIIILCEGWIDEFSPSFIFISCRDAPWSQTFSRAVKFIDESNQMGAI